MTLHRLRAEPLVDPELFDLLEEETRAAFAKVSSHCEKLHLRFGNPEPGVWALELRIRDRSDVLWGIGVRGKEEEIRRELNPWVRTNLQLYLELKAVRA
jgi:hypothetical protein